MKKNRCDLRTIWIWTSKRKWPLKTGFHTSWTITNLTVLLLTQVGS